MKKKTHNFEKSSSSFIDDFILTTPMCLHQKNNWWRDLLNHLEFRNTTKRMSAGKRNSTGITTDLLMISARKIIVNVKKLTGRLREAKGELPQEISSRGGWYTTCKI